VRFWDSSAIVPLVCREAESSVCRAWLRADSTVLVWALASTEVISALARKRREGTLTPRALLDAKRRLAMLEAAWSEVEQYDGVRARARRLLETHPLRAADALHLAAALVVLEERTSGVQFVTFDGRLGEAARKEGFETLGEAAD
jgi:hypothetical protein